jgi:hypothetical protein
MTNQTDTPADPAAQKQALLEAFDSVLKQQSEAREAELRDAEARRRAKRRVRPWISAMAAVSLVLCSYLYVEQPEWLFPGSAIPESVAIKEASLRIGMANVAQKVERHRQRTGSLPRTLAEAGTRVNGMAYDPLGSATWRLVGSNGGIELTLTSQDSLPAFIGNSFDVISRRPR